MAVGGVDLSLPLEEHNPDSLILHEEFNRTSLQNDIALILLSSPIEFSKEKIPICLPFMCDTDTWQHCWAAGWESASAGEVLGEMHLLMEDGFYPFEVDVVPHEGLPRQSSAPHLPGECIQTPPSVCTSTSSLFRARTSCPQTPRAKSGTYFGTISKLWTSFWHPD